MKPTIPYTYLIKHKESGKLYHGSRTANNCNPEELLKENGYITSSSIVKNIIKEEGLDSFEIVSIEIYNDKESARLAEEEYHKFHNVKKNPNYINKSNAGGSFYCTEQSKETRDKISKTTKGIPKSEETKAKFSVIHKGKTISEETRKKLSDKLKGIPRSKEAIAKGSETRKGKYFGVKHTEESKEKNRLAHLGKKDSEETKRKKSAAQKGRKHTEESKLKISETKRKQKLLREAA